MRRHAADINAVIDYAIEKDEIKMMKKRKKKVMVLGHSTGGPICGLILAITIILSKPHS